MTVSTERTEAPPRRPSAPLPEVVRAYADRAVMGAPPRRVRIEQRGEMRLQVKGRWRKFTAVQELAADRNFFEWRARVSMGAGVPCRVVDRLAEDGGSLDVRLLGIRIQHADGPEVSLGQQMRYLSEIVWNPGAFSLNAALRWRDLRGRRIQLSCAGSEPLAQVEMHFDGHGDPVCVTALRPRLEGAATITRPWAAHMWRYSTLEGLRIPTRAEVRWDLPSGPFAYWRGEIVALHVLD